MSNLFARFRETLRDMSETELAVEIAQPRKLLIETDNARGKRLEIVYAPFDHVNLAADLVIVGLTPGRQQMRNALIESHRRLAMGEHVSEILKATKTFASFSGPMRTNLVAMLDSIAVNRILGIQSCISLWADHSHRIHFTSALRYPVFVDGENFSGTPNILETTILKKALSKWFAAEMYALPNAIFLPLGPHATTAVYATSEAIGMKSTKILSGLPHPSGANGERIAFFLGRKRQGELSNKVNPAGLIAARAALESKISALGGWS